MKSSNWLTMHINVIKYIKGVAETLVADNLRIDINRPDDAQHTPVDVRGWASEIRNNTLKMIDKNI